MQDNISLGCEPFELLFGSGGVILTSRDEGMGGGLALGNVLSMENEGKFPKLIRKLINTSCRNNQSY